MAEIVLIGTPGGGVAGGVGLLGIIVPELDEEVVAFLEVGLDLCPVSQGHEALGAAAVVGVVDDLDAVIQEVGEHHSPAALGVASAQVLGGHGGVADEVDGEAAALLFGR